MDESSPFCDACKNKIVFINDKICDKCGAPVVAGKVCDKCKNSKYHFDKARAVVSYNEFSSPMITKFKYAKAKYLENRLSEFLVQAYKKYPEIEADIITFIPMTQKKLKDRGFNQTEALAILLGKNVDVEVKNLLVKTKETVAQAGLEKDKRLENIQGSFEINKELKKLIKNKRILIVDDVFTTGSTSNECAKVLKKAGASSVFVLTVAKTL